MDNDIRATLSKDFSEEHPFSKFALAQLRVSIKNAKTRIVKTAEGTYQEVQTGKYSIEEFDDIRMQWGAHALEISKKFNDLSSNLETVAFSWFYQKKERINVANSDFYQVGIMIISCMCYMCFHMQSIFLAFVSLFNVVMSIPITMVIYRYALGVTYFSNPHLSIIIVIIGIGADDIFVFHDIWKGSFSSFTDSKQRLNYTFKRA